MTQEDSTKDNSRRKNSKEVLLKRILRQKSGLFGAFLILLFLTAAAFPGPHTLPCLLIGIAFGIMAVLARTSQKKLTSKVKNHDPLLHNYLYLPQCISCY